MAVDRSILIIDDDVDFCCLLQIALQEAHVTNPVEIFHNGQTAVENLRYRFGELKSAGEAPPALMAVDLRMPGMSGLDVLKWVRAQPALKEVPVVIFTGLEGGVDLEQAYAQGATSMREKPFRYRDLVKEAGTLRDTYLEEHALKHAA